MSGIRCTKEIPAGHFVCSLIGELITEGMVLDLVARDKDSFIYPLDFFMTLFKVSETSHGSISGPFEAMP